MESPLPRDRCNVTLGALFLLGAASLLPWNFFITANDYWMFKFRNTSEAFSAQSKHNDTQLFFGAYLSITSNIVFIVFLGLNTLISKRVSHHTRIVYPLILTIALFVVTTSLVEVDTDQWQREFLIVTLLIVALINVLIGFIMGASMGVCGYLPPQYMACCSLGQAAGGLICCATQVICILLNLEFQDTAFIYFSAATAMLTLTLAAYSAMRKSEFFERYTDLADSNMTFSSTTRVKVPYLAIIRKGWQYHLSSFLVYVVTISVFPALILYATSTQVSSGSLLTGKLFIPLACFTVFNGADCIGRYAFNWIQIGSGRRTLVLWLCVCRVILVPFLLFCNIAPLNRAHTSILIHSDFVFVLLIIVLGASNGYLISAAFVFAPKTVELELQEVSASIASCSAGFGSAVGSVLSYGVVWLL